MLPKNIYKSKKYIGFVFIEQNILKILKNRNTTQSVGVGEKLKVDLDSMGLFVLKSTYVTKKI